MSIGQDIFREVGKEYGYENVDADFSAFREIKIKWQRSYGKAEFKISDYLNDAPEDVFRGVAETLFKKISGQDVNGYPQCMVDYLASEEFLTAKRPKYLARIRNTNHQGGQHKSLTDSIERVRALGLVNVPEDMQAIWINKTETRLCSCSTVFKLIMVSVTLDKEDVPDYVLDYLVYENVVKMAAGVGQSVSPARVAIAMSLFPHTEEARDFLETL